MNKQKNMLEKPVSIPRAHQCRGGSLGFHSLCIARRVAEGSGVDLCSPTKRIRLNVHYRWKLSTLYRLKRTLICKYRHSNLS